MTGNKTAIAELIKEALARTEVIGRDEVSNGFSCFFGEEIFPPLIKNQAVEMAKEKK